MTGIWVNPHIQSMEAEQTTLGLMLSSPRAAEEVLAKLDPEHFFYDHHKKLYGIMADLYGSGAPVDVASLVVHMKDNSYFDGMLTPEYVGELPIVDTQNTDYWCKQLLDKHKRRQVYEAAGSLISTMDMAEAMDQDAFDHIVGRYNNIVASATMDCDDNDDSIPKLRDRLLGEMRSSGNGVGYSPGWGPLEKEIGRIVPGKLIVLSAYSGQGKSTLLANMFVRLILQGANVAVFPTEMGRDWFHRVVCIWARVVNDEIIPYQNIERGIGLDEDADKYYVRALDQLFGGAAPGRFTVNTKASMTPTTILAGMRTYRRQGFNIFMIDHGDRLRYDPNNYERHRADTCIDIRNLAKDTDATVLLAYQPRKPDNITGDLTRPLTDADIRGRSEIWNEADITMFPYRPIVRCNEYTGTTEYDGYGYPDILRTKRDREEVSKTCQKLDDENFHIKISKRRAGGEGDTTFMQFCKVSGTIMGPVFRKKEDTWTHQNKNTSEPLDTTQEKSSKSQPQDEDWVPF